MDAELTPVHRSPAALRRADAVVGADAGAGAAPAALRFADAVERAAPEEVTGAIAVAGVEATDGRGAAAMGARVLLAAGAREALGLRAAPLAVAELRAPDVVAAVGAVAGAAAVAGAWAGAGAGAGAGAAGAGGTAAGAEAAGAGSGAGVGGAAGDAGVPKPGGVHAQAKPAPATATLSNDNTTRPDRRALVRTDPPQASRRQLHAIHIYTYLRGPQRDCLACRA